MCTFQSEGQFSPRLSAILLKTIAIKTGSEGELILVQHDGKCIAVSDIEDEGFLLSRLRFHEC